MHFARYVCYTSSTSSMFTGLIVQVHFSISDYTLSGCSIDQQSITTFPPVKHKTVVCEL